MKYLTEWRFLPYRKADAFENMAMDEAIFRQAQVCPAPPTLRFYGWRRPSVSLGYFQHIEDEIDTAFCRREGIDIVWRPTGGKAVYHLDDLTYAVIAGNHDAFFPKDLMGTYRVISQCLREGLRELGVQAAFTDASPADGVYRVKASCFSASSRFELQVDGKKLCGSAQVRSRGVFLQHGSLLVTFDAEKTYDIMRPHLEPREEHIRRLRQSATALADHIKLDGDGHPAVCAAWQRAFARCFGVTFREGDLTPGEERLKSRLLQDKYGRPGRGRERGKKT